MKYLLYILATAILFTASAYIATAQTANVTVTVIIDCNYRNMIISKCAPEGYWDAPVTVCEI